MVAKKWLHITDNITRKQLKHIIRRRKFIYTISPSLFPRPDYWESNVNILEAEKELIAEETVNNVDNYLQYVVSEWMTENKLALESNVKVEAAEKFISGIKELMDGYNLELDESQSKVVEMAESKVGKLEDELNAAINENIELNKEIETLKREKIIATVGKDLTESQKEKLNQLVADFDFINESNFEKKVKIIWESKFAKKEDKKLDEKGEHKDQPIFVNPVQSEIRSSF